MLMRAQSAAFVPHNGTFRLALGHVVLATALLATGTAVLPGPMVLGIAASGAVISSVVAWQRNGGWLSPFGIPLAYTTALHVVPIVLAGRLMFDGQRVTVANGLVAPEMANDATTRAIGVFLLGFLAALLLTGNRPVPTSKLRRVLDRPIGGNRPSLRVLGRMALVASIGLQGAFYYRNGAKREGIEGFDAELTTMGRLSLFMGVVAVAVATGHRATRSSRLSAVDGSLVVLALCLALTWGSRSTLLAPALLALFLMGTRGSVRPRRLFALSVVGLFVLVTIAEVRRDGPESIEGVGPSTVAERVVRDLNAPTYLTYYTIEAQDRSPNNELALGSTYLGAVPRLLPSAFLGANDWDIPELGTARYRELIGFEDPRRSFGFAAVAEGVLNFGAFGALGSGVAIGGVLGWSYRRLVAGSHGLLASWTYPVLFASLPWLLRSDLLQGTKPPLYALALLAASEIATRTVSRKQEVDSGKPAVAPVPSRPRL